MRRAEKIHSPTLRIYFFKEVLRARVRNCMPESCLVWRRCLRAFVPSLHLARRRLASASTSTAAAAIARWHRQAPTPWPRRVAPCPRATSNVTCMGWGFSRTLAVMVVALRARHLPTAALLIKNVLLLVPCGARAGAFADGHTASNAPDLFRPPKLSGAGPG